jgi:hypothetical protein
MRTVRRRIYAAHLTVCRGIIEQLEQVEIDAFPTAFVTLSDQEQERGESGTPIGCNVWKNLTAWLHADGLIYACITSDWPEWQV